MRLRLLTTLSVGLLAAACQAPSPYQQRANVATAPPGSTGYSLSTSEQACGDYGFTRGTAAFDRCVSRERNARANGRVNQDYAQAQLNSDARDACSSYGLEPGSPRYDGCVSREIDARRYRDGTAVQSAPAYRVDQSGYRIDSSGYRVDSSGYRVDAAGYRIDSAGYRIDNAGYRVDSSGARI